MAFDAGAAKGRVILDDSDFQKGAKGVKSGSKSIFKDIINAQIAIKAFNKTFQIMSENFKNGYKDAVDYGEEVNKLNVVFSKVQGSANKLTKELTQSFGFSKKSAVQLTAATGDLLTGLGFTQDSAIELSGTVQKLSADLVSFSNYSGGIKGASEALTKALLEEREPIKSLGISILETDVQQRLLEKGQNNLTGTALKQAKAQATLELAMEQSKNAIGDYARTSESLANKQRQLQNKFEDLRLNISKQFLPVMNILVTKLLLVATNAEKIDFGKIAISWVEGLRKFLDGWDKYIDKPVLTFWQYTLQKKLPVEFSKMAIKVTEILKGIGDAFKSIFEPIQILNEKGIAGIGDAVKNLFSPIEKLQKVWQNTVDNIEIATYNKDQALMNYQNQIDAFYDERAAERLAKFKELQDEIININKEGLNEQMSLYDRLASRFENKFANRIIKATNNMAEKIKDFFEGVGGKILDYFLNISDQITNQILELSGIILSIGENELTIMQTQNEAKIEELQLQKENELLLLEEKLARGQITEEEYAIQKVEIEKTMNSKIAIEKQKAKDKENAKKKEIFEANKKNQIAQAWIQAATGIISAWTGAIQSLAWMPVVGGALAIAMAAVLTGLILGTTIAQTVAISQQKFIPERRLGGSAEGMTIIGETGRGEMVNLPGGTTVIPPDLSSQIAKASGKHIANNINVSFAGAVIDSNMSLRKISDYVSRDLSRKLRLA